MGSWKSNKACRPTGHYWDSYPGAPSISDIIATHLNIRVCGCPMSKWVVEAYYMTGFSKYGILPEPNFRIAVIIQHSMKPQICCDGPQEHVWRQAIIWSNAIYSQLEPWELISVEFLSIGNLGTNYSGILTAIQIFSFNKIHLKMSSEIWRPFVSGSMCWCNTPHSVRFWAGIWYCSLILSVWLYRIQPCCCMDKLNEYTMNTMSNNA